MIRSCGCWWSWGQPWATARSDHGGQARRTAGWRGWRDLRPRLALACWRCTTSGLTRFAGRDHGPQAGGERFARCGTAVAGWEINRFGGRPARCSSCLPDPWTSTSGRVQGDDPVVTVGRRVGTTGELRRHPAGTGSSGTGVPPASGTAARATTVFGSSPNATPLPADGIDANAGDYPRRRDRRGEGIRAWGAGNGAPKPNVPDQVDTTGPGCRIGGREVVHTLDVDTTVVRSCAVNRHVDLERVDKSMGRVPRNATRPGPGNCSPAPPGQWCRLSRFATTENQNSTI
jgi:hypothetical protein